MMERELSKNKKKVENDYITKMKKKKKQNKPNLEIKLQYLTKDKEYKIRKSEREYNKKLYKLEQQWRKENKLVMLTE